MDIDNDPQLPLDSTIANGRPPSASPQAQGEWPLDLDSTLAQSESAGDLLGGLDVTMARLSAGGAAPAETSWEASLDATIAAGAGASLEATMLGASSASPGEHAPGSPGVIQHEISGSRFEILGPLGKGGMGTVHRARDCQIEGRMVALKVLHPRFSKDARFRELFFQEIHASQGFVSENAVQIRDTGLMPDGSLFLTMDLVRGESLGKLLRREGALAPSHAFEIARQILLGLHSGHEHGLVHRDVKPSNVMLAARIPKTAENPFGVGVRLLDFGIAGLVADQQEGELTGTPTYMSPEQVQGQRLDARSDLFAVGIVLYEMLTGARPFEGQTLQDIETSILETRIEPLVADLRTLPRPVRKVLVKALKKDRRKRYQSADEFLRALERSKIAEPTGGMGILARTGLGLLATAASAEAVVILHQRGELEQAQSALESSAEDARLATGEDLAALNLRLVQKESELTRLQARIAEEGDLDTRNEILQRDYARLQQDHATLQRRNEELERRVNEIGTARFSELPGTKTAVCFDEVLRRIEHGAARSTVGYLKEQAKNGIFSAEGVDGRELVYDLVGAAAAIESSQRATGVDLGQLDRGKQLLQRVREGEAGFRVEAAQWLAVVAVGTSAQAVDPGATADQRMQALQATMRQLEQSVAQLQEHGQSSATETWQAVAAGPDDQDPDAAFAHAALYGPGSLTELLERYAAHLERTVVQDGSLLLDALEESKALTQWGPWLAQDGEALDGLAAQTVRAFWCAHGWYVERLPTPPFKELFEALPEVPEGEPRADWRAQLALQLALAEADVYPLPPECSAVMRHTWIESSSSMWFLERLQSMDGEGWRIERRIHDLKGESTGRPQSYLITRQDDVFYTEGIKGLDLRSAEAGLRVGSLSLTSPATLPDKPWVRGFDLDSYTEALRSGPVACLVVRAGDSEFWFSPRLGLVRESRGGVYERDLVFFSAQR